MNTEPRPKLVITLTPLDKTIETFGWVMLALIWVYTILNFSSLPDTIPTHFNSAGQADNYGSKGTIFILPIIGTVLFLGLSIVNMFPHIFNYPKSITIENAERQYRNATRLMRYLKCAILFIFLILLYLTSQAATDRSKGLGTWFMPVILALIFIPLVFFVIKSVKEK